MELGVLLDLGLTWDGVGDCWERDGGGVMDLASD